MLQQGCLTDHSSRLIHIHHMDQMSSCVLYSSHIFPTGPSHCLSTFWTQYEAMEPCQFASLYQRELQSFQSTQTPELTEQTRFVDPPGISTASVQRTTSAPLESRATQDRSCRRTNVPERVVPSHIFPVYPSRRFSAWGKPSRWRRKCQHRMGIRSIPLKARLRLVAPLWAV